MSALTYIVVTPAGILNALRLRSAFIAPGVLGILSAYAYYPKPTVPGTFQNTADWAVVALTSAAVFAALAALFATSVWWDFGVSLDLAPWRVGQECALAGAVVRGCSVAPADAAVRAEGDCAADRVGCSSVHFSPALTCPFYPEEPATQQCIACGTVVSKLGMHFEARRESESPFFVRRDYFGPWARDAGACRPSGARAAAVRELRLAQAVERRDDVPQARQDLDAALDFRGNPLTAQVSSCCIGCFTYQRCHNLLPRLAQICAFTALPLACAPWAASNVFRQMPAGFNGLAGVCAAFWAGSSFFLAMDSVATPMAFMRKYSHLPFPYPDGIFRERTRDILCGFFSADLA